MERPKAYCIVRKDLPPALKVVQAREALQAATAKFGRAPGSELVLLEVQDEHELLFEFMSLKNAAVCHFNNEMNIGYTSLATHPFEGGPRFPHLKRLELDGLNLPQHLVHS